MLNTDSLRKFKEWSTIDNCFKSDTNPLIRISWTEIKYAKKIFDKQALIINSNPGDQFIIARAGRCATDVFVLSEDDKKIITGLYDLPYWFFSPHQS